MLFIFGSNHQWGGHNSISQTFQTVNLKIDYFIVQMGTLCSSQFSAENMFQFSKRFHFTVLKCKIWILHTETAAKTQLLPFIHTSICRSILPLLFCPRCTVQWVKHTSNKVWRQQFTSFYRKQLWNWNSIEQDIKW